MEKKASDYEWIKFKFRANDLDSVTDLKNTTIIAGSPELETEILENQLINRFDKTAENPTLDYKDIEIVCVVIDVVKYEESTKKYLNNLRNVAEIADDADENKKPVKDRDSEPGNVKDRIDRTI